MPKQRVIDCIRQSENYEEAKCDYNIIGIDPSWITGLIDIKITKYLIDRIEVKIGPNCIIDIKREVGDNAFDCMTINDKIKYITNGINDFIHFRNNTPNNSNTEISVEEPLLGCSFKNKSTVDQGRLFQAIIDYFDYSKSGMEVTEMNVSTAKSSIKKGAQMLKKWQLHEIIEDKYKHVIVYNSEKYIRPLIKHREAVLDAFSVAMGLVKLKNYS